MNFFTRVPALVLCLGLVHSCAATPPSKSAPSATSQKQLMEASAPQRTEESASVLEKWSTLDLRDRRDAVQRNYNLLSDLNPPPPVILPYEVMFEGLIDGEEVITLGLVHMPKDLDAFILYDKFKIGPTEYRSHLELWAMTDAGPTYSGNYDLAATDVSRVNRIIKRKGSGLATVRLSISVAVTQPRPTYYQLRWYCLGKKGAASVELPDSYWPIIKVE